MVQFGEGGDDKVLLFKDSCLVHTFTNKRSCVPVLNMLTNSVAQAMTTLSAVLSVIVNTAKTVFFFSFRFYVCDSCCLFATQEMIVCLVMVVVTINMVAKATSKYCFLSIFRTVVMFFFVSEINGHFGGDKQHGNEGDDNIVGGYGNDFQV